MPLNNPENNYPINLQWNGAPYPTYAPLQTWLHPPLCVQKTEGPASLRALETEVPAPLCALETEVPALLYTIETAVPAPLYTKETESPAPLYIIETEAPAPSRALETEASAPSRALETEAPASLCALETKVSAPLCYLNETDRYNLQETGISVPSFQLLETGISALSHDELRLPDDVICSYIHGEEQTYDFQVTDQNRVYENNNQDFRNSISSLETYSSSNFVGNRYKLYVHLCPPFCLKYKLSPPLHPSVKNTNYPPHPSV